MKPNQKATAPAGPVAVFAKDEAAPVLPSLQAIARLKAGAMTAANVVITAVYLWKQIISQIAIEEGWSTEQLEYVLSKREEMFNQALAEELERRKWKPPCEP